MNYFTSCIKAVGIAGFLLLLQLSLHAGEADSLLAILRKPGLPDSARVLALAALAPTYRNVNNDSMIAIAQRGIALAQKTGFARGEAICSLQVAIAHFSAHNYTDGHSIASKVRDILKERGNSAELCDALHWVGIAYYFQSNFDSALKYFEAAEIVATNLRDKYRMGKEYYYIAGAHNDQGNFTVALDNYLKGLKLQEQINSTDDVAASLADIAMVHVQLGDTARAREYIDRSLAILPDVRKAQSLFACLCNVAITYGIMKKHDKALVIFERGYHLADSMGNSYWKNVFLANKAEVYTSTGQYEHAAEAYTLMRRNNEQIKDVNIDMSAESGIGRILYTQGKRKEGLKHMETAFDIMRAHSMKRMAMESSLDLAKLYEDEGDYRKALFYSKAHRAYKDSIFNETNDKKVQQLQFDYELEKKQRQIDKLNLGREKQKADAERKNITLVSLVAVVSLLCITIGLMYRNRLREQQSKAEIMCQAAKLDELNRFKDKAFSVLSHDLRGPVNAFTSIMHMFNEQQITGEEFVEMKPEINRQLSSLNLLLDNVLLWAKSHMKDAGTVQHTTVDLAELTRQNIALLKDTADRKEVELVNNIDEAATAMCNEGEINIVLRNLVMNAIKFTNAGGAVTISSVMMADTVSISVTDTGIGMSREKVDGLFAVTASRNTYGTAGETGIGLGLLLCNEFVAANKGTISVASEPGKGSVFTITLPRG